MCSTPSRPNQRSCPPPVTVTAQVPDPSSVKKPRRCRRRRGRAPRGRPARRRRNPPARRRTGPSPSKSRLDTRRADRRRRDPGPAGRCQHRRGAVVRRRGSSPRQVRRAGARVPARFHQASSSAVASSSAQRPAVQPQLLEEAPRLADLRARRDVEQLHDLVAVQIRTHPRQVLLGGQLGDPRLQLVVVGLQPRRPALVAGGAVGANQLVQPGQQRSGVGRRSGAPRSRSTCRRRSRGTADADRPAARRRRPSAWSTSAPASAFAPSWRRPPRGGGSSPRRRARAAGGGLADVVQQRRPAQHQIRAAVRALRGPPARSPAAAPSANAGRRPCADGVRRWPSACRRSRAAPPHPCRSAPSGRCRRPGRRPAAACPVRRPPARR